LLEHHRLDLGVEVLVLFVKSEVALESPRVPRQFVVVLHGTAAARSAEGPAAGPYHDWNRGLLAGVLGAHAVAGSSDREYHAAERREPYSLPHRYLSHQTGS
jgi:hypothetical protein